MNFCKNYTNIRDQKECEREKETRWFCRWQKIDGKKASLAPCSRENRTHRQTKQHDGHMDGWMTKQRTVLHADDSIEMQCNATHFTTFPSSVSKRNEWMDNPRQGQRATRLSVRLTVSSENASMQSTRDDNTTTIPRTATRKFGGEGRQSSSRNTEEPNDFGLMTNENNTYTKETHRQTVS